MLESARDQSGAERARRRGAGLPHHDDLAPPPGATTAQLAEWGAEQVRRCKLVIAACEKAGSEGSETFYHPLTGEPCDVAFYLENMTARLRDAEGVLDLAWDAALKQVWDPFKLV